MGKYILPKERVDELYEMLKEFDKSTATIFIPAWNENHNESLKYYFINGIEDNHSFKITIQRKGRIKENNNLSISFFDCEPNNCLGRLDLGKDLKKHRDENGNITTLPHFHYAPELTKKIILLDEFLKQAKPHETVNQFDFSSMLLIFLCYINVDRKGIPVMEVFV